VVDDRLEYTGLDEALAALCSPAGGSWGSREALLFDGQPEGPFQGGKLPFRGRGHERTPAVRETSRSAL